MSDAARFIGGPMTAKAAYLSLADGIAQWALFGQGAWAVDTSDGTFVGQISVSQRPGYPEREIGWTFLEIAQGKGYATEAAAAARAHVHAQFPGDALVSYIDPDNAASIRVAEKLGAVLDPAAPGPDWSPAHVYRHPAPEARP